MGYLFGDELPFAETRIRWTNQTVAFERSSSREPPPCKGFYSQEAFIGHLLMEPSCNPFALHSECYAIILNHIGSKALDKQLFSSP